MKTVNDIPDLFDTQDSNDKRILINIPDESRPFFCWTTITGSTGPSSSMTVRSS